MLIVLKAEKARNYMICKDDTVLKAERLRGDMIGNVDMVLEYPTSARGDRQWRAWGLQGGLRGLKKFDVLA